MRTREKLRHSNFAIFDQLAVGVALIDSKTKKIIYANSELENLSLYSKSQLESQNFLFLFSSKVHEEVDQFLKLQPIHSQLVVTASEFILRRKNKSQISVSMSLSDDPEMGAQVITLINNEPRKELERELEQAYAQMIQTSKFISLAEMAAGIAHEINNPLAIAHAYAEQMQKQLDLDPINKEKIKQMSQKITKATLRASEIIISLKKLSRSDEDEAMGSTKVGSLIDELQSLYQERCSGRGIDFQLEIESREDLVLCSSSQILQVLLNLMENAVYAVKDQGEKIIKLKAKKENHLIRFSVEDNGPGVPEKLEKEIMNPFFTTKEVGEGTGLGLSISRSIVEKHKGRLVIDKMPKGACFSFCLPLTNPVQAENHYIELDLSEKDLSEKQESLRQQVDFSNYNILVVDDEKDLQESLKLGLEERAFKVFVASNGQQALEILKNEKIDVVVSDVKMPVLGGVEFIKEIFAHYPDLNRVFVLTGSRSLPEAEFYSLGVRQIFLKPVSLSKVFREIEESILPDKKYLTRTRPRVYFKTIYELGAQPSNSPSDRVFNIGHGGMFVQSDSKLPSIGDFVRFQLKFTVQEKTSMVSGVGKVVWTRPKARHDKPRGFGMKFYSFSREGFTEISELINDLKNSSFIPDQ